MSETLLSTSNILLFGREVTDLIIRGSDTHTDSFAGGGNGPDEDARNAMHDPSINASRAGHQHFLWQQLAASDARLARIYGFSYDGAYYDLPRPVLFLVHGEGEDAETAPGAARVARAPDDPSRTGVAAAEFSFGDGVKVWSYDKADYTIRMDVETGMFEQVLLNIFFGGGPGVSGAHVSGAHVSGAHVSGAHVSGAHLAGLRGRGRGRGGTD